VAAAVPSPTTKGVPLATVVLLVDTVPPFRVNWPPGLVGNNWSEIKLPPLRVTLPLGTENIPDAVGLVTAIVPPVTRTWPVEKEALPTKKRESRLRLPPETVSAPVAPMELVVSAATRSVDAATIPHSRLNWPLPPRPTKIVCPVVKS